MMESRERGGEVDSNEEGVGWWRGWMVASGGEDGGGGGGGARNNGDLDDRGELGLGFVGMWEVKRGREIGSADLRKMGEEWIWSLEELVWSAVESAAMSGGSST
ncbi:uncharacterized protein A4U43_C08F19920 [Asparagus officinalis]|nr:uncharacterized protein A4U43_C08F19920 [Asparagus officinalis]